MHTTLAPASARPVPPTRRRRARAFTLTELLIVIGLIVLVISLAVPAFKAMTGGRSIDAAQNQLSAVLGARRAEAIGLQKVRGVFFYLDPATERVTCRLRRGDRPADHGHAGAVPRVLPRPRPRPRPALAAGRRRHAGHRQRRRSTPRQTPPVRLDDGYIGYNVVPGATRRRSTSATAA